VSEKGNNAMMELFSSKLNIDFLAKGTYAIIFSLILVAGSIYIWVDKGESKYGLDYQGGNEFIVALKGGKTSEELRKALEVSLTAVTVQAFEASEGLFAVRTADAGGSEATKKKFEAVMESSFAGNYEIKRSQYVGPTIGKEMKEKATIALVIGLLGILIYVAVRFELAFAVGAVLAIFHDVIVATGVYLFVGNELTMGSLAAALTIVGYSVNDTIVIFDRVREEIMKRKDFDLRDIMNQAVNSTLSRTVVTSLLTLFTAIALMIFGGGAIKDLSVFLVVGIIAGSYSTIFIASPITLAWHNYRMRNYKPAVAN
jgi:preprotein translocase SecF subunit